MWMRSTQQPNKHTSGVTVSAVSSTSFSLCTLTREEEHHMRKYSRACITWRDIIWYQQGGNSKGRDLKQWRIGWGKKKKRYVKSYLTSASKSMSSCARTTTSKGSGRVKTWIHENFFHVLCIKQPIPCAPPSRNVEARSTRRNRRLVIILNRKRATWLFPTALLSVHCYS